jgi:hypothetical protein
VRSMVVAVIAAAALSACGLWEPWAGAGDCDMKPVGEDGFRIGPKVAMATSCASSVEVDGRRYSLGVGKWLDEDSLTLTEYAPIIRAIGPVANPQTFSIEGIDPLQMLVMEGAPGETDDLGPTGPYMVLWGNAGTLPEGMCAYADPLDVQYPGDVCPLQRGRTYGAEMITACGFESPMGPYGGLYWRVVNPPADPLGGSPYPGMYEDLDYGTVELLDDGRLTYVSELGAELTLERVDDPEASNKVCPRPDGS